jgi:hypothetical protein
MPRNGRRIAILGAGIMGSTLALFLARRGQNVTVFDRESIPLACASRWNEGKIHLGYLYGADPSLATARKVLPGGLRFRPLLSELIESDITAHVSPREDVYLVHRKSVVDVNALGSYVSAVDALVRDHPDAANYLVDATDARSRKLEPSELALLTDSNEIIAGFATNERSVDTRWVADSLAAALTGDPRITLRLNTTILSAMPEDLPSGRWRVRGAPDVDETFDVVANALWNGRMEIDLTAGLPPDTLWSNRYRLSLFVRTAQPVDTMSAVISVGPFGDVKNYDCRNFYLSWYPAGLLGESSEITPPLMQPLSPGERANRIDQIQSSLADVLPWTRKIFDAAEEILLEGGYVFARGQGSLMDRRSSLHRRDRFGVSRRGNYLSIDTGKYSTAPMMARILAADICGD